MKYLVIALAGTILATAPALAQDAPAAAAATAPAAANVTVGAAVSDPSGGAVGTIEAVNGPNATLSTGTAKANLPLTSFAKGENGLVIGMTKADLEAAVAKATTAVEIAAGAPVSDSKGGSVGTVEAVSGNLVTVATPKAKAQLPKEAFAQGPSGLVIGMTAAELEAAAAKAKGG